MLSKISIKNKILEPSRGNFIKLKYSFLLKQDIFEYIKESKDVLKDEDAKAFFLKRLSENKLGLTTGKLIKVLSKKTINSEIRFAGHSKIVDLAKCPNGFEIEPMESIVLLTNEWLHIDQNTSGVIISRVSNYTSGLVVSASYVDSNWKGLVEILVTNLSKDVKRICLGDEIGRLFFFKLEGESVESNDSEVADNSHHYGLTWDSIIRDKVDPFQKRNDDITKKHFFAKVIEFFYENYKIAGGVVGLIAVITILLNFYSQIAEFNELKETIKNNVTEISDLRKKQFEAGSHSFFVENGKSSYQKKIELIGYFEDGKIILSNSELLGNPEIKTIATLYNSGGKTHLEITILRSNQELIAKTYQVSYLVFH